MKGQCRIYKKLYPASFDITHIWFSIFSGKQSTPLGQACVRLSVEKPTENALSIEHQPSQILVEALKGNAEEWLSGHSYGFSWGGWRLLLSRMQGLFMCFLSKGEGALWFKLYFRQIWETLTLMILGAPVPNAENHLKSSRALQCVEGQKKLETWGVLPYMPRFSRGIGQGRDQKSVLDVVCSHVCNWTTQIRRKS